MAAFAFDSRICTAVRLRRTLHTNLGAVWPHIMQNMTVYDIRHLPPLHGDDPSYTFSCIFYNLQIMLQSAHGFDRNNDLISDDRSGISAKVFTELTGLILFTVSAHVTDMLLW